MEKRLTLVVEMCDVGFADARAVVGYPLTAITSTLLVFIM